MLLIIIYYESTYIYIYIKHIWSRKKNNHTNNAQFPDNFNKYKLISNSGAKYLFLFDIDSCAYLNNINDTPITRYRHSYVHLKDVLLSVRVEKLCFKTYSKYELYILQNFSIYSNTVLQVYMLS